MTPFCLFWRLRISFGVGRHLHDTTCTLRFGLILVLFDTLNSLSRFYLLISAILDMLFANLLSYFFSYHHYLGPSGPEARGNHPESFERLIQMEMSARSKQQQQVHQHHPAMAAGRIPSGMYGHELDAKLRYR